jgi:hypothetical protein
VRINCEIKDRTFINLSYAFIILFSIFPLLFNLPFRIHLDLPFEGAYRMYLGQMPFKDFGIPFGYAFFLLPTLFFHLFGPSLVSLLYAQALLNLISGIALVNVLISLKTQKSILFISVFVYCLSYIFIYFWPWHTHTGYTFGLVALSFILKINEQTSRSKTLVLSSLAGLFSFLAMFTKQDYGGLNLVFCLVILSAQYYFVRNSWSILGYISSYALVALSLIAPLLKYDFGYWFNYGQPPHTARLEPIDFLNELFLGANWEKFYLLAIAIILYSYGSQFKKYLENKTQALTLLIVLGMIGEALLTKVTSRMSTEITTYYHAFTIAFILGQIYTKVQLNKVFALVPILGLTMLWWSPMYWRYAGRMFNLAESKIPRKAKEVKVQVGWELSEFKSFRKIKIPVATIEGIRRLKQMDQFKNPSTLKVMNLTELTSLPYELGYTPITGIPLWYDLDVAIFPKQVQEINAKIKNQEYDVFLFESVPSLDNFYPEDIRTCLKANYKLVDTFLAPRKEEDSSIEVYVKVN